MTRKLVFPWIMAPLLLSACAAHETAPVSVRKPPFPALDAPTRLAQNEGYLPDVLPEPEQRSSYEKWFGDHLAAMKEPSWAKASPLPRGQFKLRILYLPSFAPAHAVRVEKGKDWTAAVTVNGLNGRGGYAPGSRIGFEASMLPGEEVGELSRLMADANLATLPFSDKSANFICTDGMRIVFELVDDRGHHMAERHECETKGPLRILARHVDQYRKVVGADIKYYWH